MVHSSSSARVSPFLVINNVALPQTELVHNPGLIAPQRVGDTCDLEISLVHQ